MESDKVCQTLLKSACRSVLTLQARQPDFDMHRTAHSEIVEVVTVWSDVSVDCIKSGIFLLVEQSNQETGREKTMYIIAHPLLTKCHHVNQLQI